MSAKPRFKPRVGWTIGTPHFTTVSTRKHPVDKYRVRVTDARDLTAEKAVEKVLQGLADERRGDEVLREIGMVGTFVNGKVRVRRSKQ